MRCEACHGIGELLVDANGVLVTRLRDAAMMVPCPACGGCGISYCCSGADGLSQMGETPGVGGPALQENKVDERP